ncbi:hypothetical protein JW998_14925 [candidate division KSB1 bacterium]|nr:hypothetical protein [candidate division KSB1 bacterium]
MRTLATVIGARSLAATENIQTAEGAENRRGKEAKSGTISANLDALYGWL